jgi:hypothetical protein
MSDTIPCVGDLGTPVYIRILDEDGRPLNTVTATALTAAVVRPSGLEEEIALQPSNSLEKPSADGWAVYQATVTEPSWFDEAGRWRVRPRFVVDNVGAWRASKWVSFRVAP